MVSVFNLLSVTNYSEMLKNLTIRHFLVALFCLNMIGKFNDKIHNLLSSATISVYGDFKLPIMLVILALIWAIFLSHVFKLHDWIDKVFRIRERYDYNKILIPIAEKVTGSSSIELKEKLKSSRHSSMSKMFYNYASSTDPHPLVGKHNVNSALTSLTWYWTGLEAAFTFLVTAIILLFFDFWAAVIFSFFAVICIAISQLVKINVRKYTRAQVQKIVSDSEAHRTIGNYLDAL